MAQNNGDFTVEDCRAVMKYLFLKGNSVKKKYYDMSVTLGDKHPLYYTANDWVARFITGYLSSADERETNSSDNSRKQGCRSFHDPGQLKNIL
jgi:hypothetical protein